MKKLRVIECGNGHRFKWSTLDRVGWCPECGSDRLRWIRRRELRAEQAQQRHENGRR